MNRPKKYIDKGVGLVLSSEPSCEYEDGEGNLNIAYDVKIKNFPVFDEVMTKAVAKINAKALESKEAEVRSGILDRLWGRKKEVQASEASYFFVRDEEKSDATYTRGTLKLAVQTFEASDNNRHTVKKMAGDLLAEVNSQLGWTPELYSAKVMKTVRSTVDYRKKAAPEAHGRTGLLEDMDEAKIAGRILTDEEEEQLKQQNRILVSRIPYNPAFDDHPEANKPNLRFGRDIALVRFPAIQPGEISAFNTRLERSLAYDIVRLKGPALAKKLSDEERSSLGYDVRLSLEKGIIKSLDAIEDKYAEDHEQEAIEAYGEEEGKKRAQAGGRAAAVRLAHEIAEGLGIGITVIGQRAFLKQVGEGLGRDVDDRVGWFKGETISKFNQKTAGAKDEVGLTGSYVCKLEGPPESLGELEEDLLQGECGKFLREKKIHEVVYTPYESEVGHSAHRTVPPGPPPDGPNRRGFYKEGFKKG